MNAVSLICLIGAAVAGYFGLTFLIVNRDILMGVILIVVAIILLPGGWAGRRF